jgi:hypothetical protein
LRQRAVRWLDGWQTQRELWDKSLNSIPRCGYLI